MNLHWPLHHGQFLESQPMRFVGVSGMSVFRQILQLQVLVGCCRPPVPGRSCHGIPLPIRAKGRSFRCERDGPVTSRASTRASLAAGRSVAETV